jgi:serine/threonine protein kinase
VARLTDFGLSKIVVDSSGHSISTSEAKLGTLRWICLDYIEKGGPSLATDVYSFSCTALEVRDVLHLANLLPAEPLTGRFCHRSGHSTISVETRTPCSRSREVSDRGGLITQTSLFRNAAGTFSSDAGNRNLTVGLRWLTSEARSASCCLSSIPLLSDLHIILFPAAPWTMASRVWSSLEITAGYHVYRLWHRAMKAGVDLHQFK